MMLPDKGSVGLCRVVHLDRYARAYIRLKRETLHNPTHAV